MEKARPELAKKLRHRSVGGGMVTVTATGKGRLESRCRSNPQAVDPKDVAMLEDLVLNGVQRGAGKRTAARASGGSGQLSARRHRCRGMPK